MNWKHRLLRTSHWWIGLSYLLMALLYIHPGELPFFSGSETLALGDGTDPAAISYYFEFLVRRFFESPFDFLFGAIHLPYTDAPSGMSLIIPMGQRIAVLMMAPFVAPEQMATGLVLIGMVLNGLCMYVLARLLKIPRVVAWGMGLAWAVNAYTRARAKVHMGSVGIYHLPLVFIGLHLVAKGGKRNSILAAFCFLTVAFMNQYFIVMLVPLVPILLWHAHRSKRPPGPAMLFWRRLVLCALPGTLWLLSNLIMPMPPWVKFDGPVMPKTGETREAYHPFLSRFAARPMDYFTGDVGIGTADVNPLRENMNGYLVATRYEGSNPHERAEGIRWILWFLAAAALLGFLPSQRKRWPPEDQALILQLVALGALSFLLSLSPAELGPFSPAFWLHKLVSQFRVSNRAGIGVHFAVLLVAGLALKNWLSLQKAENMKRAGALLFVVLILLELPPLFQPMPMSRIMPRLAPLVEPRECGVGMTYPYVSNMHYLMEFYQFVQRMRGSRCPFINANTPGETNTVMVQNFGVPIVMQNLGANPQLLTHKLTRFARCVPLSWVVFDPLLGFEEAKGLCDQLGWTLTRDGLCRGDSLNLPFRKSPLECLTN